MLLQKISVAMGLFALASASVVVKRQSSNSTIPIPDACTSQCTNYTAVFAATTPQEVATFCTSDIEQDITTCFGCIETNAPDEITPQAISNVNDFVSSCTSLSSPIPSFAFTAATGATTANTAPASLSSANGGTTAAPTTSGTRSAAQSTATTSHSGAMTLLPQTFGVACLVVALTALMVV